MVKWQFPLCIGVTIAKFLGNVPVWKEWLIMMHKNLDKGLLVIFINLIGKTDVR